ncbi:SPOR domain-containing protein [Thalassotalea sp. Y01]|uniref:SPOR domain-containing protein n=1 Tax=Thalassotalea sp. Y01 TaxID=2729613 RepID=UPI00145D69B0|nr:SPOR domain-containing protein [Thalassotalea sp. Y01]NMP17541.1 hypothetical protein [Thalassotalea sp. Y01]
MSTPLQNRLVGTVIVAAAAVIFLPSFFDGEKKAYQAQFEQISQHQEPVKPIAIKDFDQQSFDQLEQPPEPVDEQAVDAQLALANQTTNSGNSQTEPSPPDEQATPAKPVIKQKNIDNADNVVQATPAKPAVLTVTKPEVKKSQGFVIQLGSFAHKKNVEQLLKKLKSSGYTVFTKPIKTKAGDLTKVFIGPEINKASLEAKIPKLEKLTGVRGKIAKFEPIDS